MKKELCSSEQVFLPKNGYFPVICVKKWKNDHFWCFGLCLRWHISKTTHTILIKPILFQRGLVSVFIQRVSKKLLDQILRKLFFLQDITQKLETLGKCRFLAIFSHFLMLLSIFEVTYLKICDICDILRHIHSKISLCRKIFVFLAGNR